MVHSYSKNSEDVIIAYLKNAFPEQIGDDAAVLSKNINPLVISKDILVEDVHFRRRYQTPKSLAYKALAVNLSDIAAMGAAPHSVLLGLSASATDVAFVNEFLSGFVDACRHFKVTLIGGDTTRSSSNQLFLSITILGHGDPAYLKYRHHGKVNDIIYVAGHLGDAHLGFMALEKNYPGFEQYKDRFLNPTPRIAEGLWLGKQQNVHAMMDLSDGLWLDLHKLITASQCSADIDISHLPICPDELAAYEALNLQPIETKLSGGEDYGLLVTVHPLESELLAAEFQQAFGYPLIKIGRLTRSISDLHQVICLKEQEPIELCLKPFTHFP